MRPLFESLETRQLLSGDNVTNFVVTLTPPTSARVTHTGTLLVQGSSVNDVIDVSKNRPSNTVIVHLHATLKSTGDISFWDTADLIYVSAKTADGDVIVDAFSMGDVKRITVDAGAGNDAVTVDPSVKKGATLIGGKGKDSLTGGNYGDTLSGGDGNDVLIAGPSTLTIARVFQGTTLPTQPVGGKLFIPGAAKSNVLAGGTVTLVPGGSSERADSADLLEGGAGNDTITAGNGPDTVNGGAGTDTLKSSDTSKLTISGVEVIQDSPLSTITVKVVGSPRQLIQFGGTSTSVGKLVFNNSLTETWTGSGSLVIDG